MEFFATLLLNVFLDLGYPDECSVKLAFRYTFRYYVRVFQYGHWKFLMCISIFLYVQCETNSMHAGSGELLEFAPVPKVFKFVGSKLQISSNTFGSSGFLQENNKRESFILIGKESTRRSSRRTHRHGDWCIQRTKPNISVALGRATPARSALSDGCHVSPRSHVYKVETSESIDRVALEVDCQTIFGVTMHPSSIERNMPMGKASAFFFPTRPSARSLCRSFFSDACGSVGTSYPATQVVISGWFVTLHQHHRWSISYSRWTKTWTVYKWTVFHDDCRGAWAYSFYYGRLLWCLHRSCGRGLSLH